MKMPTEYKGTRWYKCDLHVHTPEDARHWLDSSCRLNNPRTEQDLQEKARCFLQYCHKSRLDCIAITDHNFSAESDYRKCFLTHLTEQNQTVAEEVERPPLIIFPGFELDIRYHLVCLFAPATKGKDLQLLSDTLSGMGLPPNERFINGNPQQPKHHGQCWSLREVLDKVQNELEGIVIAAHAFTDDGICNDTANIEDFVNNPDLYAIEINTWPPNNKAKSVLDGTNTSWKRPAPHHQPASIRSSDGKHLGKSQDPDSNPIGGRFTWIKMSSPSIESLRQAFLDPESRIYLDLEPPEAVHTRIHSISIQGTKFLADQTVRLSPHLNCIIGGRGSGKSMLFESLRIGLRGEMAIKDTDHVANQQISRLYGTFTSNTRIELHVNHAGLDDRFVVEDRDQPARIENREVEDPPTVFRQIKPLIFSQEEITELSGRQKTLLNFIDNLARERLEPHRQSADDIADRLREARQIEEMLGRLDAELAALKQEVQELARQIEAKAQVQEELKRHRAAQDAKRYLETVSSKAQETEERLKTLAEELEAEPPPLGSRLDTFPEKEFFTQVEQNMSAAYRELAASLQSASQIFRRKAARNLSEHPDWMKARNTILKAEELFSTACDQKGLTPQEAERLRETEQQHRAKQAALLAKQAERDALHKKQPEILALLNELAECWREETREREHLLEEIVSSDTMPLTEEGKPIVQTTLIFSGNREAFLKAWGELSPDRRTTVGRIWDDYDHAAGRKNIGEQLFEAFHLAVQQDDSKEGEDSSKEIQKRHKPGNPVQWLELHLNDQYQLPPIIRQYLVDIMEIRALKTDKWFNLLKMRIPDTADLALLRSDGTHAGSFAQNDLSIGQKNTAILSLLLARGNGPVLIDQPENELDSEFLFRELVPMFRKAKMQRQLIIVTHNANIPVNADSEFVYALEARNGHGLCRSQGGLDRSGVTRSVLDIMEGSEEAFRRRKEKYHF